MPEITPQEIFEHYAQSAMVALNDAINCFQQGDDENTRQAIKTVRTDLRMAMNVLRAEFGAADGSYINFDLTEDE